MDKHKVVLFIENSFLKPLVSENDITDISYNGEDLYYVSNIEGRKKSDIKVENGQIKDFIRQIANLCEQQFSYSVPELDIFVDKYRINATHGSIAKVKDDGVVTFSIRIASEHIRINDSSNFFTPHIVNLLKVLILNKQSIIIGGVTSTGKTEFQKFILTKLPKFSRVIVVDNVLELDRIRNDSLDLTCWQSDERNPNANPGVLIKSALRNNPDWLILAEARDKEMIDVLNSAMTGMPIITTLHSLDVFSLPHRMGRMMMKGEQKIDFNDALTDIYYHFHFYFYLSKKLIDGKIERFVSQVCCFDNNGKSTLIYDKRKGHNYYQIPQNIIDSFIPETISLLGPFGGNLK